VAGRPAPAAAPGSAPASDRTLEHAWAAGKTPAPPGDGQARSSATIHIEIPPDLETQAPKTAAGAAPRKDSDRPTIVAQPRAASGAPTIRLRPKTAGVPPAAAGTTPAARPDAPRVQGDEAPDAGKEPSSDGLPTARTVRAVFPAPVGPATIKLAKPSGARIAAQVPTEAKKKTSRIPLESALDTRSAEPAAGPVPKTIRLKKSGEAGTLKAEPPAGAPASGPSDTSKLDLGAEGGGTPTQRKTIKVKRPTQRPDQSGGPETAIGAPQAPRFHPPPEEVPPDQPSAVFSVVAIAAILVLCVVIYLQMAQALGPDLSLTRLSYGAPGLDLAWPGKIPVGQ
jgi:hypothetical protein